MTVIQLGVVLLSLVMLVLIVVELIDCISKPKLIRITFYTVILVSLVLAGTFISYAHLLFK